MTGPKGNSEFFLPKTLDGHRKVAKSIGNQGSWGFNKTHCFPRGQSLTEQSIAI